MTELETKLLAALRDLTEWGCTYTTMYDPDSPHELLIAARAAINEAEKQNGPMPEYQFVTCETADGWSLHAPGSSNEAIANGDASPLVSGPWENKNHVIPHWAYTHAAKILA